MARTKVGWGIMGCGWIAEQSVAPAISGSDNGRLVAVASRDKRVAEQKAHAVGAARAYAPYEALLLDPEIDAVYIGLPNGLHEEWALRCAAAGKHVLCEKSLALSLASARRVGAAFATRGLRLVEAFMYRHHPQWQVVRGLLDEGAIGKVHVLRGSFCVRLDRPGDHRWSAKMGGGTLWDLTCYPIDAARYVMRSEPLRATAMADTRTPEGVDATSSACLEFPDAVQVSVAASLVAGFEQSFAIVGGEGVIELSRPFVPGWDATRVSLRRRDGAARVIEVQGANQFLHQIEHFASLAQNPTMNAWPAEDGARNVAACEAVEKSWQHNAAVSVEPCGLGE
jgi:xylose dehydrogenase (NAD/NADP)